jgi:hypothetical protein
MTDLGKPPDIGLVTPAVAPRPPDKRRRPPARRPSGERKTPMRRPGPDDEHKVDEYA